MAIFQKHRSVAEKRANFFGHPQNSPKSRASRVDFENLKFSQFFTFFHQTFYNLCFYVLTSLCFGCFELKFINFLAAKATFLWQVTKKWAKKPLFHDNSRVYFLFNEESLLLSPYNQISRNFHCFVNLSQKRCLSCQKI